MQEKRFTRKEKLMRLYLNEKLKKISPIVISATDINRLNEVIRKSEIIVNTQIENFRAIDSRATQIMSVTGLMLSILAGIVFSSGVNTGVILLNVSMRASTGLVIISGLICLVSGLFIIQSDTVNSSGNDGMVLLKDISDLFSEHRKKWTILKDYQPVGFLMRNY